MWNMQLRKHPVHWRHDPASFKANGSLSMGFIEEFILVFEWEDCNASLQVGG